jgi:hypothetical protein
MNGDERQPGATQLLPKMRSAPWMCGAQKCFESRESP